MNVQKIGKFQEKKSYHCVEDTLLKKASSFHAKIVAKKKLLVRAVAKTPNELLLSVAHCAKIFPFVCPEQLYKLSQMADQDTLHLS